MRSYTQIPPEAVEQRTLFEWAALNAGRHPELQMLFHIPNGGKRSKTEAARFKQEGVKAGVPDIFLPVPRGAYHGLFVEMKRIKDFVTSAAQKKWIEDLNTQGYKAVICYGWADAAETILDYLEGGKAQCCATSAAQVSAEVKGIT